jgi:NAD(P)H-hydrate epimerase
MKILSAEQIRQVDQYTIEHDGISSHDLMERAAGACCEWIEENYSKDKGIWIFCGPGNNGGDGLAIARILFRTGYQVKAWILNPTSKRSKDSLKNEILLKETDQTILREINSENDFPLVHENVVLIDALFGTGLSKPIEGLAAKLILHLNDSATEIVAIDLPSGLFADQLPVVEHIMINARHTLSFQLPKLSFLFPASYDYVGSWHILKIGLSQKFIDSLPTDMYYASVNEMKGILKPRLKFSHKGSHGHALLISGGKGKIGAAVIAASACLRSGVGLLSVQSPWCGVEILQTAVPEAMVVFDHGQDFITDILDLKNYSAIAVGPGTGTSDEFSKVLEAVLRISKVPLILDADALNSISNDQGLLKLIPAHSILTPHIKEFDRLFGVSASDAGRFEKQKSFSKENELIIILKGAHTCITTPEGKVYFNSTGNPGMAKGGSGDALTGILLALLAQGYSAVEAARLGVFLHGMAGDIAKEKYSEYSMTAMDIVGCLGEAFKIV